MVAGGGWTLGVEVPDLFRLLLARGLSIGEAMVVFVLIFGGMGRVGFELDGILTRGRSGSRTGLVLREGIRKLTMLKCSQ